MNYSDKLRQTNREALMTLCALAFVIIVWLVCGFGLSCVDVQIFHLPLWVVGGLFGTWIAAIVCSIVLARAFKDFSFKDDDAACDESTAAPSAVPTDAAGTARATMQMSAGQGCASGRVVGCAVGRVAGNAAQQIGEGPHE